MEAITSVCDESGLVCAMMPHPERVFMKYQWPYWPEQWDMTVSPWLQMFQNARKWCETH